MTEPLVNGFGDNPIKTLCNGSSEQKESKENCINISSSGLETFPKDILKDVDDTATELYADFNDLTEIPDELIGCLPNLEVLSANGNQIESLSNCVASLKHLRRLELIENELVSIPSAICDLCGLQTLRLTGNNLKTLPEKLGQLSSLELLYIDENAIKSLPSSLGQLTNLTLLEASNNQLSDLPVNLGDLTELKVFNVSNNHIEVIPDSFEKLSKLEQLDLSVNGIEFLPENCRSTRTLKKFYVERNVLTYLPDWVNHLPEITEFSVRDNHLMTQQLTNDFGKNSCKLRDLNISGNFMTVLPESFGNLKALEEFHMGSVISELERRNFQNGNWVSHLPRTFSQAVNIRELHLDENQLQDLPEDFGQLINLEFLDLGQNIIRRIPDSFCKLRSLRVCQLSKNSILKLPENIGDLQALEDFRLDNNQIGELPESFVKLNQLKSLDLFNNQLTEIPKVIYLLGNLVRLDLGENALKIAWYKVPNLIMKNRYPLRDPELKDNWRGKNRAGVRPEFIETNKIIDPVDLPEEEDEEDDNEEDLGYNSDFLRRVAIDNLSLWRSHDGPKTRPVYSRPQSEAAWPTQSMITQARVNNGWPSNGFGITDDWSETESTSDQAESTSDKAESTSDKTSDLDWSELDELKKESEPMESSLTCEPVEKHVTPEPEEDWDEEIENELGPYEDIPIYKHPPSDRSIIRHDVKDHYFRAWDIHAQTTHWYDNAPEPHVEEGQFEDCEE